MKAKEFKIFSVMKFRSLSPILSSLSNGRRVASLQTRSKRSLGKSASKMIQNPNNIASQAARDLRWNFWNFCETCNILNYH